MNFGFLILISSSVKLIIMSGEIRLMFETSNQKQTLSKIIQRACYCLREEETLNLMQCQIIKKKSNAKLMNLNENNCFME